MILEPEIASTSIVLLGKFNPAIFHPAWFELHEIVTASDGKGALAEVVHPDLSIIQFESMRIQVEPNRFTVETRSDPSVRIADLVAKTFGEFLQHTPISTAGINRQCHFRLQNAERQHAMGRRLAPIEPWGKWATRLATVGPGVRHGMRSLTMQEIFERDGFQCHMQGSKAHHEEERRGGNGLELG